MPTKGQSQDDVSIAVGDLRGLDHVDPRWMGVQHVLPERQYIRGRLRRRRISLFGQVTVDPQSEGPLDAAALPVSDVKGHTGDNRGL